MINGAILYGIAIILTGVSLSKSKEKTIQALLKAWKMFQNIMPDVLAIMLFVGLSLSVLTPSLISSIMGDQSGALGVVYATIIGSVSIIPGFVVFPLGATLVQNGAGLPQVSAFMASLMSVGIVTLRMEKQLFGRSFAYARNAAAVLMCVLFSLIIWLVMAWI
ncbi:hypothetical protein QTG56_01210 [Rossellomorea sp. AcN35-11]|nr:hypothetical protein [Rossellomorea aquimaris]WJV29817.1 hypothetical protein QTG56_01210 [Rossellomorea sp. AcN35-11]